MYSCFLKKKTKSTGTFTFKNKYFQVDLRKANEIGLRCCSKRKKNNEKRTLFLFTFNLINI